jgi:DNA-binding PucR family transcriptional regulator
VTPGGSAHPSAEPLDTEVHLVALVLGADTDALHDLRARALAPLSELRPATAKRLAETLRSWLLNQGRRDDVAADLHVHAQTVRYRMTQVRELFGDRLTDPVATTELIVALAAPMRAGE